MRSESYQRFLADVEWNSLESCHGLICVIGRNMVIASEEYAIQTMSV